MEIIQEGKKLRLRFPYNKRLLGLVKGCEGARWHPEDKTWTAKDTSRTQFILNHVRKQTQEYLMYYQPTYPKVITGYPLWKRQQYAAEIMIHCRRNVLAGDMGVGKTLIGFAVMDFLPDDWDVWWIAPKSALKALAAEYRKWKPKKQVTTINPGSLSKLVDRADKPPRILFLDESADYKSPTSGRTKEALGIAESMEEHYGNQCAVYLLSGTPAPNGHLDWWSQCEIARPGFIAEKNWYKFRDRYAFMDYSQSYPVKLGWKEDEVEALPARMGNLVIRIDKQQLVHDGDIWLPDKEYIVHDLPVDPEHLGMAHAILAGESVLKVLGKLRQISDGFMYDADKNVDLLETPKDDKLIELVKGKMRVIVFAAFTATVDKLAALLRINGFRVLRVDGRGWQMDQGYPAELATFQDTDAHPFPVAFLAQSESGGEGLTLTAAEDIIFYSNSFKARYREQAEDRVYRPGATACRIHDMLYFPVDGRTLATIKNKMDVSSLTLEQIRGDFGVTQDIQEPQEDQIPF